MNHVELDLLEQGAGVHERFLRFAGEADDDVGNKAEVRHQLPRMVDDRPVVAHLVAARHPLEDGVVARLHRQLELTADHIARSHDLEQFGLEVLRMRGEKAQPHHPANLLDLADQRGESTPTAWIAVVVDVLAQQHDLFGAVGYRLATLRDNLVHRHVALAPSHLWHDAESAVVVAALDDAHVMADACPPSRGQRLTLRIVVTRFEAGQEVLVIADRNDRVELRKSLAKNVALLRDDAAGDGDRALRCFPGPELVEPGVHAVL